MPSQLQAIPIRQANVADERRTLPARTRAARERLARVGVVVNEQDAQVLRRDVRSLPRCR
jgi:hypothetical protein